MLDGKDLLICLSRGTYGRFDDARGALILASSYQSRAGNVTVLLRGDGVYMALGSQEPNDIGLESLISLAEPVLEMGGRIVAVGEDLTARGLSKDDILEWIDILPEDEAAGLLVENDLTATF